MLTAAAALFWQAITADVTAALEKWGSEYSLQICGHSLGGSLATIYALLALANKSNDDAGGILLKHDFKVYTFGAAQVRDQTQASVAEPRQRSARLSLCRCAVSNCCGPLCCI